MSTLQKLSLATLLCLVVGCAHQAVPVRETSSLEGHWRSERPEPLPPSNGDVNYLVRRFTFGEGRWTIDYGIYDDEALQTPLLSGRNEGRYVISSMEVTGNRWPAEFMFERRTLTPHVARFAQVLNASGCGTGSWQVGQEQSVIDAGCEAFRIFKKSACDREYDVASLEAGRLFLGARPADGSLCTADRRPATLGAPLVKE